MPPPLPRCSRWAYSSLKPTHQCQPSPKPLSGRPAHCPFRGLLSVHSRCGLHTRAVTNVVTVIRRLQTFRHLHACSGCFRLERLPGGACTHWKCAAFSRRTRRADIPQSSCLSLDPSRNRVPGRPATRRRLTSRNRVDTTERSSNRAAVIQNTLKKARLVGWSCRETQRPEEHAP